MSDMAHYNAFLNIAFIKHYKATLSDTYYISPFVYKYLVNDLPMTVIKKIKIFCITLIQFQRRSGLRLNGLGQYVNLPMAWTELAQLAQCKGKIQEGKFTRSYHTSIVLKV